MSAALMSYRTSNGTNGGSSSALELYFKDIAYSELLTPQEEIDLAKRIRAGDRKSLNKMIESNLRFVITIAKEYQGRGLLLEDLIAEGNMGLVRAATRYDETVGVNSPRMQSGGFGRASYRHWQKKPAWCDCPSTKSNT